MQACLALAIVAIVPRSKFKASSVMPGSKHKDVALPKLHTLSPFTLLQFVSGHRLARFEPVYVQQPWNIQENSSPNNSVSISRDVLEGRSHRCGGGSCT